MVTCDITSEGRSVPWASDRGAQAIAGGIEPGETKELTYPLMGLPTDAPDDLHTAVRVIDVADAQQRQLVRDVTVSGRAEALLDQTCK